MANHDGWEQAGKALACIASGIVAAVGAFKFKQRSSKPASSDDEEREYSALARVEIHLDRISRVMDEQGINLNDQNVQMLRDRLDLRSIRAELRALANRVSDLESKSTDTT